MRLMLLSLPVLLLACGDKSDDDDDDGGGEEEATDDTATTGDDTGTTGECEGTAPVLAGLSCSNSGKAEYNGEEVPTFTFSSDVTDADGDLESYTVEIFYDTEVDGALDVSTATAFGDTTGTVGGVECEASSAQAKASFYLTSGTLEWSATYDFGMVVTDRHGVASEVSVRSCKMPDESGFGGGNAD